MATTLHVGKKIVQKITTSDGSTLPAGAVAATVVATSFVTATVDPVTNDVTLLGKAPGTTTASYAAAGYTGASDTITVLAAPSLIVTDGPETA